MKSLRTGALGLMMALLFAALGLSLRYGTASADRRHLDRGPGLMERRQQQPRDLQWRCPNDQRIDVRI